ncbi:DUF6471 domain-containing protein [Phenylobacterium koreense]|uniref:Transcriptional regulator with XRE-family HTH domain n=1 Tax=Phenylobacterium koreense TaxID=266125 RepID=A0ABV2EHH9_9CAUL
MDELTGQRWVKGTIKGEMDKRGLTYADLARRLKLVGVDENERNLRNKVARGTFSAVFFMQCLQAIGVRSLRIDILEFLEQARDAGEISQDEADAAAHDAVLTEIRKIMDEPEK